MEPPEPPPPPAPPAAAPPGSDEAVAAALSARLELLVADPVLAAAALTHKSFVNEHRGEGLQDNERLEFLGDAVLSLAVSHRLIDRFPGAREGELSKIRAAVVDEAGLAAMARELDLGSLLRVGRGEELTGGRQKSSLLADAMEAVLAALYLGGGLPPVLAVIDRFLGDAFARAAAGTLDRDYKTQLQELAQGRARATPRYRVVGERGPDHSKTFEVELELRGEVVGRGEGRSKKDAEQAAAKRGLEVLAAAASIAGEGASGGPPAPPSFEAAATPPAPAALAASPCDATEPPPAHAPAELAAAAGEGEAAPAPASVAPPVAEPRPARKPAPKRKPRKAAPKGTARPPAPRRKKAPAAAAKRSGAAARRRRARS